MKIYYLTNSRIPTEKAHGVQIMNMCQAFTENSKVDLELVVPRRKGAAKLDPFAYYDIASKFKISRLVTLDLFQYEKIIGRSAFWLQYFSFVLSSILFFLGKKRKDRVVYTRDYLACVLVLLGFRVAYECHYVPQRRFVFLRLIRQAQKIVVISKGLKNEIRSLGINEEKILLAPDGVDLKKFDIKLTKAQARDKLSLSHEEYIILYTGHLYAWKGVNVLAQAAEKIRKGKVYFVGGTSQDIKSFSQKYKRLVKVNKIELIGHRPSQEIPFWLKAADVLVLPNSNQEIISSKYTSPLKLFEYMASQRPIVASAIDSIQEILDSRLCTFFLADNADDLSQKIEQVLASSQERIIIKTSRAYEKVKSYTWQKRAGKIISSV